MPEFPEVETVVRGLQARVAAKKLLALKLNRADLRNPVPKGLAARVEGHRVASVSRRAKYILIDLDDGRVLIVHLGMAGRMQISDPTSALGRHDHVIFTTDDDQQIHFNDPRRFGLMTLAVGDELAKEDLLVAVQGVDHQLEQPLHLGLEAERFLCRGRHAFRMLPRFPC